MANLGFFSANVCYWQIRLEADSAGNPDRTQVCYKLDAPASDPMANTQYITTLWRRNPVLPPEDALVGVMFTGDPVHADMIITNPGHWSLAQTALSNGSVLPGIVGYEADATYTHQPARTQVSAHSPFPCPGDLPPGESCPAGGALMYSDIASYEAPTVVVEAR